LTRPNYESHIITPPLGLGYTSSYLKQFNYKTKIIDGLNLGISNDEIVKRCKGYDLVGISCMSDYFLNVVDLSKKLKAAGLIVVIGGSHPSALPKLTLENTNADFIIIGEGEEIFLELIKKIEKNQQVCNIPGIFTKNSKQIIKRDFIKNLNELPFPDWEQMDPRKYKKAPHGALIKKFPVAPITTTRGCPYNCKFCASPKLWNKKIRFRAPENVIEEMKYLIKDFGVREIHFEDDNLTLKKDHIEKICRLILKNNLKISWACPNGIRADTITPDLLKLMKKSGCYYIALGFESGNQEILNNINKETNLATLRNAAEMAEKQGIMTQGFFIFGLPGETEKTISETINFSKKISLSRAQFLLLDVLPGSQLWDELDFGKKVDWKKSSYHEITWIPKTVKPEILINAPPKAFRSFFFRPKQLFRLIKYFRLSQLPFVLKRISDFKIFGKLGFNLK